MDGNAITALIAGIAGLVTIFFGRAYWASFSGLINSNSAEVDRLRKRLEKLQEKLDKLEDILHQTIIERERLASRVDDYATKAQVLMIENERLKEENATLKDKLKLYDHRP